MNINQGNTLLRQLLALLPTSPFQDFIGQLSGLPYLSYLNWFFPVGRVLAVMSAWLLAIGLFYLYSVAMRWVKLIGD